MKIAIIGSRTFGNFEYYFSFTNDKFEASSLVIKDYVLLEDYIKEHINIKDITEFISGGAKGADTLGEKFAKNNNIKTTIFKADWKQYGKSAGFLRNKDIIENCDICFAFWDGISKGTLHSINLAKESGKKLYVYKFNRGEIL